MCDPVRKMCGISPQFSQVVHTFENFLGYTFSVVSTNLPISSCSGLVFFTKYFLLNICAQAYVGALTCRAPVCPNMLEHSLTRPWSGLTTEDCTQRIIIDFKTIFGVKSDNNKKDSSIVNNRVCKTN